MDQIQFETMTSDVSFHSLWNPLPPLRKNSGRTAVQQKDNGALCGPDTKH